MSDEGFHEIQLSGKQLVFLFMSGVVLLVVVFLLGVDVGRGVRNAMGDVPMSAEAAPPATGLTEEPVASSEPGKAAEPELSYHEMLLGEGAPPATDPAKPTAETAPPPVDETVPQPTTAPVPAATAAPSPSAVRGAWFLQTGAYSTQAVADGQVAKLKQLDVPAFVLAPEAGTAVKFFRVRVGPFTDRAEAEQVKGRIARQGFPSSITR